MSELRTGINGIFFPRTFLVRGFSHLVEEEFMSDYQQSKRARIRNRRYIDEDTPVEPIVTPPVVNIEVSGVETAQAICDGHIKENTKKGYKYKLQKLFKYCEDKCPGAIENGLVKVPMNLTHLQQFLGDITLKKDGTYNTDATIGSYISAIKWMYTERGELGFNAETNHFCKEFRQGYSRLIAEKRANGEMKNYEGKVAVTFAVYRSLAKQALFAANDRTTTSMVHAYMLLCWNLFARSVSVTELRTTHLVWEGDALKIDFSRSKSDQSGEKQVPKHLFANPYNPEICVVLALALHVFGTSFRPEDGNRTLLFTGSSYSVFHTWLDKAIKDVDNLGFDPDDYGTHSFRKGIATYSSGFIGGPSVIAIFLRAGWSLGQVQDRYIKYSDGSDQFCGRVAAGLNFNGGSKFAVLPPRFKQAFALTVDEWKDICPGYDEYPTGFQSCLPYLLASLVFHHNWWSNCNERGVYVNISGRHPILTSRLVLSGIIDRLKDNVIGISTLACAVTGMKASGIPPHVYLAAEVQVLREENLLFRQILAQNHNEVMDKLPELVVNGIVRNINVQGIQQMSVQQLEALLNRLIDSRHAAFIASQPVSESTTAPLTHNTLDGYRYWVWGEMFRPVPSDWSMPTGKVKSIVDLFITGMPALEIRPFRLIRAKLLANKDQKLFIKAFAVYKKILEVAAEHNIFNGTASSLTIQHWDSVFEASFSRILDEVNIIRVKKVQKAGELSYITIYEMLLSIKRNNV